MKKVIIMFSILFIFGCGQENENGKNINQIEKITNENMIFSIEDFKSIGYKINKEYDVSELESAEGAWYGFWKNSLNKPIDYELRIYPSQKLILDKGLSFVEEVIGENAVLKKSASSWKEGIQDRRSRNNSSMSGSEANSVRAKYLDYFINGNVIILCSGLDITYATQNCSDLSSELVK
tara:strand:+ start:8 stop:544 length:537 start_codon:yes stop_codon:yes gene_type:complete